jgi:nucleotide-binding universal stress UspA family protein
MTCVVVATDLSARADRAIDRAKLLNTQLNGSLCVVHATNLAADEQVDKDALDRQMRAATGLTADGDAVSFLYRSGSPPKAIANACEACGADILVLGPARYNALGDFFLGTAIDYILRNTTRPVLVVKNRANAPYKEIIAGTDFSPGSAHAILTAARLFPEAKIHIVNAWRVPFKAFNKDAYVADEVEREHREQMDDFLAELSAREARLKDATSKLVQGSVIEALRKGLELNPEALVVLGSHGASGFTQATIGSVTSDLLRYLDTDTLVVNASGA